MGIVGHALQGCTERAVTCLSSLPPWLDHAHSGGHVSAGLQCWSVNCFFTEFTDLNHRMAPAAFYNEGYESIRDSTPSQLIVYEQSSSTSSSSSSLSIAPRWNRSTFANSDEVPIESTQF